MRKLILVSFLMILFGSPRAVGIWNRFYDYLPAPLDNYTDVAMLVIEDSKEIGG